MYWVMAPVGMTVPPWTSGLAGEFGQTETRGWRRAAFVGEADERADGHQGCEQQGDLEVIDEAVADTHAGHRGTERALRGEFGYAVAQRTAERDRDTGRRC